MASPLDMSLTDWMKSKNNRRGRGRGGARQGQRGGGRGITGFRSAPGASRRGPLAVNARPSSHAIAKTVRRTKNVPWQRGLLEDSLIAAGYSAIEAGTKLYVSNLDLGVTNEDIKELFSEIGKLKHYALHYDRNGRSNGSAEVVFIRSADALAAMKRYNNVQLDGKKMKIEMIGANLGMPVSAQVNVVGGAKGRGRRTVVMTSDSGRARTSAPLNQGFKRLNRGGFQRGRGRGRGRIGGRGRGRGRKEAVEKSADELNKELESYHAEAMNTS